MLTRIIFRGRKIIHITLCALTFGIILIILDPAHLSGNTNSSNLRINQEYATWFAKSRDREISSDWFQRRQEALSTSTHKKIMLFCYMKGGSTFLSEIIQKLEDVTFWYEPYAAFYMAKYGVFRWNLPQQIYWLGDRVKGPYQRRTPTADEIQGLVKYNHDLLTCNISGLPNDMLSHYSLRKGSQGDYFRCIKSESNGTEFYECQDTNLRKFCQGTIDSSIRNKCPQYIEQALRMVKGNGSLDEIEIAKGSSEAEKFQKFIEYANCEQDFAQNYIEPCLDILKTQCHQVKAIGYKALRLTMNNVQDMLENDPDMHVIYLVRDPRSIVSSRKSVGLMFWQSSADETQEAVYLCQKMYEDLVVFRKLNQTYKGAIKMVRYEDILNDPQTEIKNIFSFLGESIQDSMTSFINQTGKGHYDAQTQANKWREGIPADKQNIVTKNCLEVLKELNYNVL